MLTSLEVYNIEDYKNFENLQDYIKRANYLYIIVTEVDGKTNFEIVHSAYESKAIEKISLSGLDVKKVLLINIYGEIVSVKPDFVDGELKFKYDSLVDTELISSKMTNDYMYLVVLKNEVMFVKFMIENELKELLLKEKDTVNKVYKIGKEGKISGVNYGFATYEIEIKNSRDFTKEVRKMKRLEREEFRRERKRAREIKRK